jgi:hypothetical protein
MGSMNVYDDGSQSWGGIGTSLAGAITGAPTKAAAFTHAIETIKDQRIARQREQEKYGAAQDSIAAFPDTLQKAVAPDTMAVVGPYTGDINDPATTAGLPMAPVDYTDPRKQAQLDAYNKMATAAFRQQALAGKPEQFGPMVATATVGGGGVPADPNERNRLNFLMNGKFMTADERAAHPAHNLAIHDANGATGRSVSTQDFKTELGTGRPLYGPNGVLKPGEQALATGPASAEPLNPLKDEGARLKLLSDFTSKIAGSGYTMTVPEAVRVGQALEAQYGTENKIQSDGYGRIAVFKNFQPREIPGLHGRLADQVNQVLGGATAAAPAPGATAAAPAPVVATGPRPISTEIVSDAAADKSDAAAMVALTQVKEARGQLLGHLGADANGVLPPQPTVPNWMAAMANEKLGGTVAGNNLVNAADPKALAYFQTSKRLVEPILRLASGAAINKGEYSDYYQMFIPAQGDTPQMIADKLNAIRTWQVAVGRSRTANGLLQMVSELGQGNPVVQATVERMRVKATQGGRGDAAFNTLPTDTGGGGGNPDVDAAAAIVRGGR